MNLRGTRTREDPEINFIPLIDVLLVILIFLMVTTTYQRVAELQITLPEAEADAAKQRPKVIWIGCSDSRVSEHQMTGSKPGTMFVHRHGCQGGGQPDRQGEEALAG